MSNESLSKAIRTVFPGGELLYGEWDGGRNYFVVYVPGKGYWVGWGSLISCESTVIVIKPLGTSRGESIRTPDEREAVIRRYDRSGELIADARQALPIAHSDEWRDMLTWIINEMV